MESGFERVLSRAATVDDLLSDAYEPLPGQKADADIAARRLAAWCRASASGDWSLFAERLNRDGWSIEEVLARFATVRRDSRVPGSAWIADAGWISAALQTDDDDALHAGTDVAFAPLLAPLVSEAQTRLWSIAEPKALDTLTHSGHADCTPLC